MTNGIMIFLKSPQQAKDVVAYLRERKIYIRGAFDAPYTSCVRVSIGVRNAMERFINEFEPWVLANLK